MPIKTKYEYYKLREFTVTVEDNETGKLKRIVIDNAYSVLSSIHARVSPNYFEIIVHKQMPHLEFSNSWVVSERSTGMIIVDPSIVGNVIRTRDQAVDLALKEIKRNAPTKTKAIAILDAVKKEMRKNKAAYIEKALDDE